MLLASTIHNNGASLNAQIPAPFRPSSDPFQMAGSVRACCLTPNRATRVGFPLSVPHVSPLQWPKWRIGPTVQGLLSSAYSFSSFFRISGGAAAEERLHKIQFPLLARNCVSAFPRPAEAEAHATTRDTSRDHLESPEHQGGAFGQLVTPTADHPHEDGCFSPHLLVMPCFTPPPVRPSPPIICPRDLDLGRGSFRLHWHGCRSVVRLPRAHLSNSLQHRLVRINSSLSPYSGATVCHPHRCLCLVG